MPHTRPESTTFENVLELLTEHGFGGLAEAMKIERSEFLGAGPYERSEDRRGHANGFKPKRLKTRVGEVDVRVPQVRGVEGEGFYQVPLFLIGG